MTIVASSGPLRAARIAAWLFLATGALMALSVTFGLTAPLSFLIDLVFWPLDGAESASAPETRLAAGIAGGLLAGWGWTLLAVLRRSIAQEGAEGWAWRAVLGGLLIWFALDSAASLAAGAAANVVGNLVFLALLGVPLALMRRSAVMDRA